MQVYLSIKLLSGAPCSVTPEKTFNNTQSILIFPPLFSPGKEKFFSMTNPSSSSLFFFSPLCVCYSKASMFFSDFYSPYSPKANFAFCQTRKEVIVRHKERDLPTSTHTKKKEKLVYLIAATLLFLNGFHLYPVLLARVHPIMMKWNGLKPNSIKLGLN